MNPWLRWPILNLIELLFGRRRHVMRQNALLWVLAMSTEQQRPLGPMLLALAQDESNYHWSERLRTLAKHLNGGMPLPDALERVRLLPGPVLLAIRVGAETGTLPATLQQIAKEFGDEHDESSSTLEGTFLYLAALIWALLAVGGFVMYYIIPKFKKIFEDFGTELPELTIWVIQVADAFVEWFWLIVLIGGAVWVWLAWRSRHGASSGPMRRLLFSHARGQASLILRILAVVVEGGRPLTGAISTMARHHPSSKVRHLLLFVRNEVEGGGEVWELLAETDLLKPAESRILEAAQRAGNLPWALRELAASIERDVDSRTTLALEILRPVCLLVMGIIVGIFAVGMFLPLIKLINDLA